LLRLCTKIWGECRIVEADPEIETHDNVLYVPLAPDGFYGAEPAWGIYDAKGELVQSGAYRRGAFRALVGHKVTTSLRAEDASPAPDPIYIYGGPVLTHYGHYLTASLSRFWYFFRNSPRDIRILMHSECDLGEWFEGSAVATTLATLNLHRSQFVRFTEPTLIRKLIVPAPAFEEQHHAHRVFGAMCRWIGAEITAASPEPSSRPVYLSKHKLANSVIRIGNEIDFISALESAGVEIVSPEALPFPDQVALFASRQFVIGMGSPLHTAIFTSAKGWTIGLAPSAILNANQVLMDRLRGGSIVNVTPEEGCAVRTNWAAFKSLAESTADPRKGRIGRLREKPPQEANDAMVYDLKDPGRYAKDIVQFLRLHGAT
jgi:hypothetical protein